MSSTSPNGSADVAADINYFSPTAKVIETKDWKPRLLGDPNEYTRRMTIRDVRGMEDTFELDQNGFKFIRLPMKPRDMSTDEEIQNEYYCEIGEILKALTGATTIHIFNHCIRQCAEPSKQGSVDAHGRWQVVPSGHPHVDYAGRPSDLHGTLEELNFPASIAAKFTSASRFAFINAWRPLKTVQRDPLAVADAATVPDADYQIRARQFRRTCVRSGNYVLSHGAKKETHRWYYMSGMQPDEMVVFKQLDSDRGLPGWRCPHTAFMVEGTEKLPPRESIEVRAVCFWE
ncbi:unnamed protein product [Discula destructiva]